MAVTTVNEEKVGTVEASDLSGERITDIAKAIFEKESLSDEELMFVFDLDLGFAVGEMSISAGETRQVRQYENNNYHASIKLDMGGVQEVIFARCRAAAPHDRARVYSECKRVLYALIREKYRLNEDYLRDMIKDQKLADGITK